MLTPPRRAEGDLAIVSRRAAEMETNYKRAMEMKEELAGKLRKAEDREAEAVAKWRALELRVGCSPPHQVTSAQLKEIPVMIATIDELMSKKASLEGRVRELESRVASGDCSNEKYLEQIMSLEKKLQFQKNALVGI